MTNDVSAAILLIGDELLSGRTRDINVQTISLFLAPIGIDVGEVRIVPDIPERIVKAINELRQAFTYVFTTGGIGPTHDDITADAIAAAFGVSIDIRDDARAILQARYDAMGTELTAARLRMARIPAGASLIKNPVSGAPGFQIGNVFVMAGVPSICRAMLEDVGPRLETGVRVETGNLRCPGLREGDIAKSLGELAASHADVSIGSYPWYLSAGDSGVVLVVRSRNSQAIKVAMKDLVELVHSAGIQPEITE